MDDRKAIGIAPLVTGIMLGSTTLPSLLAVSPLADWTSMVYPLIGTIGAAAAVFVGVGILRGWEGFDNDNDPSRTEKITVVGVAIVGFCLGGVLTLF